MKSYSFMLFSFKSKLRRANRKYCLSQAELQRLRDEHRQLKEVYHILCYQIMNMSS